MGGEREGCSKSGHVPQLGAASRSASGICRKAGPQFPFVCFSEQGQLVTSVYVGRGQSEITEYWTRCQLNNVEHTTANSTDIDCMVFDSLLG